jgi:hypothetical protein
MHPLHNLFPAAAALPQEWAETLSNISLVVKAPAVLSGGAIRDWLHDKPIKDLDIFVSWSMDGLSALNDLMIKTGYERTQNISPSCEGLGEVVAVVGYSKFGEIDLNVIFLDTAVDLSPLGIASRNDFGICQIAAWVDGYSASFRFDYTDQFIEDVIGKTFTLTRTGDEGRSLRRYERLQAKYPSHRLITPHLS